MRPTLRIEVDIDPAHKRKKAIVLHLPDGATEILAYDLKAAEAARMLVPLRKAFLAGVSWFREDTSAYIIAAHPDVVCVFEEP